MIIKKKLNLNLIFISLILCLAIAWVSFSFLREITCENYNGWFSRSGAILVIASIWSALITRPKLNAEGPNPVSHYLNARDGNEPLNEHWTKKLDLSNKLVVIELLLGTIGTIIWAYGDLWI